MKADVSMFDFQRTSFQSPQELEAYVAQAKALSLFETGVDGIGCEKTLTLVTCSYEWKQARNILVAENRSLKGKKCSTVGTFFRSLDISSTLRSQ